MRWSRKQRRQREVAVRQCHVTQDEQAATSTTPDWVAQRDIEVARMNAALRRQEKRG